MGERRRTLYLDTYALIEILQGNPNYDKYSEFHGITSLMNLYELYFSLLKRAGKEVAAVQFKKFRSILFEVTEEHITKAAEIKVKHNLSYIDALGYAISGVEKVKFLTGDNDFKDLSNVEFVK